MRKFRFEKVTLVAFVLVAPVAGCGREQTSNPMSPTVIATFPANGATAVLLNTTVSYFHGPSGRRHGSARQHRHLRYVQRGDERPHH